MSSGDYIAHCESKTQEKTPSAAMKTNAYDPMWKSVAFSEKKPLLNRYT